MGKTTAYAVQRGSGADTLQATFLKAGYTRTLEECQAFIGAYKVKNPWIEGAYFPDIRKQVLRYRAIASTRGTIMYFDYERLDDETYRRAYSFLPQREVADIINEQGYKPLDDMLLAGHYPGAAINLQVHDELVISCFPNQAYGIARFLRDSIEQPIFLAGKPLVIPCTFKLGSSWECEHEFKALPERSEFDEAAQHVAEIRKAA